MLVDDGAAAAEVTGFSGAAVALVVVVERVGRVGDNGVGLEAPPAAPDGFAVSAVGAGVVQRRLKARVSGVRVRHAPVGRVSPADVYMCRIACTR